LPAPGDVRGSPVPERLVAARDERDFTERLDSLTLREHEALRLRTQILTNHRIADRCFLGYQTVKNHLHYAVRKLVLDGIDERGKLNRPLYLLAASRAARQRDDR
jgi:DNA-binding CsgD family transcriptional regulator